MASVYLPRPSSGMLRPKAATSGATSTRSGIAKTQIGELNESTADKEKSEWDILNVFPIRSFDLGGEVAPLLR